mmetsp:Transcript_23891/g.26509  ORF Transcript_23891/g.26509 Transcript_23891/m.26509 type:complete len:315 (+) Transcript_23891:73-1017(+)
MTGPSAGAIILNSGKGLNDLGDYDSCNLNPELKYALISLQAGPALVNLGICIPKACQASDLQILVDGVVNSAGGVIKGGFIKFPNEEKVEMTSWRIFAIIFFSFIALMLVLGLVIEYTPLLNKSKINEDLNTDVAQNKTVLGKAVIAFSPARNMRKLFYSPFNDKDFLKVFNGVKLLSMFHVILGHAYINVLINPTSNPKYMNEFVQPLWFEIVPGGFFAVDVFFYLSGFLGAYLMLLKFKGKRMNFFMIYFHRFYRLAPNILALMTFAMAFFIYLGNGPIWSLYGNFWTQDCSKYWWTFITFINSIYPVEQPM